MKKKILKLLLELESIVGKYVWAEICTDHSGCVRNSKDRIFSFHNEESMVRQLKDKIKIRRLK